MHARHQVIIKFTASLAAMAAAPEENEEEEEGGLYFVVCHSTPPTATADEVQAPLLVFRRFNFSGSFST